MSLFFSYSSSAQINTPSYSTVVDRTENYVVRIDTFAKKIQVGTYSNSIVYTFEKDTFTQERLENEPLYQQNLPVVLSISATRKKIDKADKAFVDQLSKKSFNKIFRLEQLDSNIWLVVTRFPLKLQPFQKHFACKIIKKTDTATTTLAFNVVPAKYKLYLYKHPWWGSYLTLHKRKARGSQYKASQYFITTDLAIEK